MNKMKRRFSFLILAALLASISVADAASVTRSNSLGQNLLTYSEQFDNAAWTKYNVTLNTNTASTTDPFGGYGAEEVRETAGTNVFVVSKEAMGVKTGQTVTASVYVKDNTRRYLSLRINSTTGKAVTFDFTLGTISNSDSGVTGKIIPVGNGWYRVSVTRTFAASEVGTTSVYHALNSTGGAYAAYAGDPGKSLYIWGAQLVVGSNPGAYNPTVASALNTTFVPTGAVKSNQLGQNLMTYSEKLGNGLWTSDFSGTGSLPVVTADYAVAPDGTKTAERVQFDKGAGVGFSRLSQAYDFDGVSTYTFSVWAKTNDATTKTVALRLFGNATNITTTESWARYVYTIKPGAGSGIQVLLWNVQATDNTADLALWGAQLVKGSKPAAYNPTVASARNTTFIPTGATKSGQLGQNLLTYSEQINNAAWLKINTTISANSINAPDGNVTADTITASGAGSIEHSAVNTATPSQLGRMTGSVYLKYNNTQWIIIGSRQGGATRYAWFDVQNGVLGTTNSNMTTTIKPVGNGWYRVSATWISSAAEGDTDLIIAPVLSNGGSTSYSQSGEAVYAWGGQLVVGSSPGTYNKTTAAALNASYVP